MNTVLGLSMTSTGIAWVLLENGDGDTTTTLDHDHFTVAADVATDGDISTHEAAVRGARAIAAAGGHRVSTICLTWSADVGAKAELLRKSLSDMGFGRVVPVRMAHAARSWAHAVGPGDGFDGCAVCVVESSAVTVVSVQGDTVRTAMTHMRESADGLARWLTGFFADEEMQPQRLYLIGARGDLELISAPLEQALGIPVVSSDDVQLALARGAALSGPALTSDAESAPPAKSMELRSRRRLSSHGRAAMILAAGVIALFAFGPELARWDSPDARVHPSADTSAVEPAAAVTDSSPSMSVHAVPSAPVVPIVVKEVIAKPVAAPAMSLPLPSTIAVADETAPEVAASQATEPVEPVVEAVQEPPPAPAITQAEPAALSPSSPSPAPQNPVAPQAFVPAPDPVQLALSPLFGGLP
ncbi:DUF7159 family protein [Mycolicibacterium celeriflavum]|uniref:DUF7159 family protein n=1 Tax=Mycolicibacterium celeriflavum TaxID=1249101 RepID=UPI003CED5AE5